MDIHSVESVNTGSTGFELEALEWGGSGAKFRYSLTIGKDGVVPASPREYCCTEHGRTRRRTAALQKIYKSHER